MNGTTFTPGSRIRYTTDNLGLIGAPDVVMSGDEGVVIGPAPDGSGWIYTEPAKHPQTICPVDPSMIEAVQ